MSTLNSCKNAETGPCGPITSQANRHSTLVNDLHRALDGLFSRLNPILTTSPPAMAPPSKSESFAKEVPSCELYGRLSDSNDALMEAINRIEDLQNRIQL